MTLVHRSFVALGIVLAFACSGGDGGSGPDPDPDAPPVAPDGVQAAARSNTSVRVTWSDRSADEREFVIQREDLGSSAASSASGPQAAQAPVEAGRVGANTTQFDDAGLEPSRRYRYRVQACNQAGCSTFAGGGAGSETATFATLSIATSSLPAAQTAVSYSHQLAADGGDGTVSWSLAGGTLPPGLALSQVGTISGTPTTEGLYTFDVQASGAGQAPTRQLTLQVVGALAITTASLPTGVAGNAYSHTLQASGGSGSYTWSLAEGSGGLPGGLALNAVSGTIAGTPPAAGTSTFNVRVASGGLSATRQLSISIFSPLVLNTTSLVAGKVGQAYQQQLSVGGGNGSYTFSVVAGSLPPGLALSATTGVVSGTPTVAGTSSPTIRVQSGDGQSIERAYTLTVNN